MNIRVDLDTPIYDGTEVVFRSPVDCSQVTGLVLYYPDNGNTSSKEFAFADAHGNNVGDIDHLFAENVVVKVILDVTTGMAFVQNADTNAYLEWRFNDIIDKLCPSFTESGSVVVCEPVEGYPLEVEWETKNLIPKTEPRTHTENGTTYTVNADGSVSISGTPTTNSTLYLTRELSVEHLRGKQITVNHNVGENVYLAINLFYNDGTTASYNWLRGNRADLLTKVVPNNARIVEVFIVALTGFDGNPMTFYPQLEIGTTATAYEPYAETAIITRCGKNTARYPYSDTTKTVNGITFTDNGDGTVTANGTATANAVFNLGIERSWALKPGADYTASIERVSGTVTGTPSLAVNYYKPGMSGGNYNGWLSANIGKVATKPCPNDYASVRAYILIPSGAVCTNLVLSVQLEAGNIATDHEQYRESQTFAVGEPITALPGGNTIYADVGNVTVKGKADPTAIINKLTNAILSLGGNV